jgi:SAM-dependent methyltransferase
MHHRLVLCPTCRLVYATPAPVPDALRHAYATAAYDSAEAAEQASLAYAALVGPVVPDLPDAGGALDIGAGDGAFLRQLHALGFGDVVGVEPAAAPVASAAPDLRPFIRVGMFRAEDFEDGRFRLVTAFQTLEHVVDPLGLCRAAHRLLREGGALVVVGHDRTAVANRLLGRRSPIFDVEHLQLFCPRSLRGLLERAGFERVRLVPITNRYPLRYWTRLAPIPAAVKGPMLGALERSRLGSLPLALRAGNLAAIAFKTGRRPVATAAGTA